MEIEGCSKYRGLASDHYSDRCCHYNKPDTITEYYYYVDGFGLPWLLAIQVLSHMSVRGTMDNSRTYTDVAK